MIHPISKFKIIKTNSEQDTTYNDEKTKRKNIYRKTKRAYLENKLSLKHFF